MIKSIKTDSRRKCLNINKQMGVKKRVRGSKISSIRLKKRLNS
jgi:hypothetical protein